MQGYIKLHRQIENWDWYQDSKMVHIFIHLLTHANHVEKTWRGIKIMPGQFLTSYYKISEATGISMQSVRTCLRKLQEVTQEITYKTSSQNTLITINNWNKYQPTNTEINTRVTHDQHTTNTRLTHTKNIKNDKNEKEISLLLQQDEKFIETFKDDFKNWYGEYSNVYLTQKDYSKLLGIILDEKALKDTINDLSKNIAEGKEKKWSKETPEIHYARIRAYWKYKTEHPEKFIKGIKKPEKRQKKLSLWETALQNDK